MARKMDLSPLQLALLLVVCSGLGGLVSSAEFSFADNNPATSNIGQTMVVPYEGYLMLDSTALTGTQEMKFALYESATSTTAEWIETQTVQMYNGRFSVGLGTGTKDATITQDFSSVVLDGQQLYLAISVYDATGQVWVELSGRQAIEPVPYSAWSANSADFKTNGNLTVGGTANIAGDTTLDGKLAVGGNTTIAGTTRVTGYTTLADSLKVGKSIIADDDLTIRGDTFNFGSNSKRALYQNSSDQLYINPASGFAAGTYVGSPLVANYSFTAKGDTTLQRQLSVGESSVFTGAMVVNNSITTTGTINSGNDLTSSDDLRVGDDATIDDKLTVGGNTTIGGTLTVTGKLSAFSLASTSGTNRSGDGSVSLGVDTDDGFCFLTYMKVDHGFQDPNSMFCKVKVVNSTWYLEAQESGGSSGNVDCSAHCVKY